MYEYLTELKHPDNWSVVAEIIQPIVECDIINDEIARENINALTKLDDLGEQRIRTLVTERLKNNPLYQKYLY